MPVVERLQCVGSIKRITITGLEKQRKRTKHSERTAKVLGDTG
jgi:hypothetical protein